MVMMCPPEKAQAVVDVLKTTKYTEGAVIIGEVTEDEVGRVVMTTEVGGQTYLPKPGNELLPRIC
jgi:hydrogenase expression/formation protein HypE